MTRPSSGLSGRKWTLLVVERVSGGRSSGNTHYGAAPWHPHKRVAASAEAAGVSLNTYIMRLLERSEAATPRGSWAMSDDHIPRRTDAWPTSLHTYSAVAGAAAGGAPRAHGVC